MFKVGDLVKVIVKDNKKSFYYPEYLHGNIGYVWQIDEEHIYIKAFRKDVNGVPYVASVDRYVFDDIDVTKIELEI